MPFARSLINSAYSFAAVSRKKIKQTLNLIRNEKIKGIKTLIEEGAAAEANLIKDANGNVLNDGDTVTIIKDLKVKGATSALKQGTKVKNIRLLYDVTDGHDIDCKIDGFGAMKLKSSVVKKI